MKAAQELLRVRYLVCHFVGKSSHYICEHTPDLCQLLAISVVHRTMLWSIACLMCVELAACGGSNSNEAITRTSTGTSSQAVAKDSSSPPASAALVQDYTYLGQFGSLGSGNGQFSSPSAVAIDPTSHNIVVTDLVMAALPSNRVQIFNSAGVYLSQFGGQGSGNGQFDSPADVAIDPTSHNILVADFRNQRVQIFNSVGVYISQFGTFGSGNGQFDSPTGIAIDPTSHNIVVVDFGNQRVQIFNAAGGYQSQFGTSGGGNGQFNFPTHVAIDPISHNIVVIDQGNLRAQIFNAAGVYLSQFGTSVGSGINPRTFPAGVAIDPTNRNIVIADPNNYRVLIFNSAGVYQTQFGTLGSGNGQFIAATSVAIDPTSHNIIVADTGNHRLQIFAPVSPLCNNTPRIIFADNAGAFGLYEGVIRNKVVNVDGSTTAIFDIQPNALLNLPFFGPQGFSLWMSVTATPNPGITVNPNSADPYGAGLAAVGVIPPSAHASYSVNFCSRGKADFTLLFDKKAQTLTAIDLLWSLAAVSPGDLLDLMDQLNTVPLMHSALEHFGTAFNLRTTKPSAAFSEVVAAGNDLRQLARNPTQFQQLGRTLTKFGIQTTVTDLLLGAPALIKVFGDFSVLVAQTQTWEGSQPIVIDLVGG